MDQSLNFAGFASGQSNFLALLETSDQPDFQALDEFINRFVTQVIAQDPAVKIMMTFIGLSDKNDDPSLSCEARRSSERDISAKRAFSARQFVVDRINERAAQNGVDVSAVDRSWLTVLALGALTTAPVFDNPSQEQRPFNRRVLIMTKEYPVAASSPGPVTPTAIAFAPDGATELEFA